MQRSRTSWVGLTGLGLVAFAPLASGCNSFDEAPTEGPRTVRIVPTDERSPVQGAVLPLPVAGGTLLSLGQELSLAASDPDRDQISLTQGDGSGGTTIRTLPLSKGAQPGRMVNTSASSFAAVLRGSGEVIGVATKDTAIQWQTKVCEAPRGIDYELATNQVHVACAEGSLVSLDATSGEVLTRLQLESDLRDVVAKDNRLYVSRFRSAEVLFVEQGSVARRVQLPTVNVVDQGSGRVRLMRPTVAWRMLSSPLGGVAIVHERATLDEVPIDAKQATDDAQQLAGANASPYGGSSGSSGCDAIVQAAVSQVRADGSRTTTSSLVGVTLGVDLAFTPDGLTFAIADAGIADPNSPTAKERVLGDEGDNFDVGRNTFAEEFSSGVRRFSSTELLEVGEDVEGADVPTVSCAGGFNEGLNVRGPATAVAFDGAMVVAQNQQLGALLRPDDDTLSVQLEGKELVDTGHDLFHRNSGSGLACASCHPEGTSDGHVWKFRELGPRRTQDLAIPLAQTAPFHWDGTLPNVGAVMDEVFVGRMGGVFESQERVDVLANWLEKAPTPVHGSRELSASAERGQAIFESKDANCSSCHGGKAFTDNGNYYVGTSADKSRLQVPSLVGIAARPPYMHNGCAKTLLERFDPECGGGELHGHTSRLSSTEVGDLVAYLTTL